MHDFSVLSCSEHVTEIKSFWGLVSYYWYVSSFAQVARPVRKWSAANVEFAWTPECLSSFQKLKTLLSTVPGSGVLRLYGRIHT